MGVAFFFYADVLRAPNDHCLSGHDGVKNYFTFIYHARHDTSFSRFAGMNHPFGEHVLFADCQPPFSGALMVLRRAGWDLTDYGVGIVNVLPWVGLGLCAGVLWLLMTRMGAGYGFAVFAAVAVTLMNPTLRRWEGHYALAYAFVLPTIWLGVQKWQETMRRRHSLALMLFITFFAWVHLYWAALAAVFLTAYWAVGIVRNPGLVARWPHFLAQALVPFLTVKLWLGLTDSVSDRPDDPYGFLVYRAAWESVFLPLDMPLADLVNRLVKIRNVSKEGYAYVGLGATALSVASVVRLVYAAYRRKSLPPLIASPPLNHALTAAVWVLLFSMGVPFVFLPEQVLEWTGPLRQFRSIGRFAWWFYFVVNVVLAVWVYRKCVLSQNFKQRILAGMFFAVWIYEIPYFHAGIELFKDKFPSPFLKKWNVAAGDFQALVSRPYFHVGSERMNIGEDQLSFVAPDAFSLSAATGLPLTSVMMSRTSFSQAMESLGWGMEPLRPPKLLERLRDQRPLLLLLREPADERIVAGKPEAFAQKLSVGEGLYALPLGYFAESAKIRAAAVNDTLQRHGAQSYVAGGTNFVFRPDTVLLPPRRDTVAWGAKLPAGKPQVLSFWLDLQKTPLFTDVKIRYFSKGAPTSEINTRNDAHMVADLPRGKFLVERAFQPSPGDDSLVVVLHAARERKAWDFMIRDGDVYQKINGVYRFNNRVLP